MTLSQFVAKLIDLEIEEGATPVWVRDGSGVLRNVTDVVVSSVGEVRYIEFETDI